MKKLFSVCCITVLILSCNCRKQNIRLINKAPVAATVNNTVYDTATKTIHVFVALCDNKYQGIVPVPAKIGNGQDLNNNLYWGCGYGVRSYFKNSPNWALIKQYAIDSIKMERIILKHKQGNFYLIADAYNGKYIQQCTVDFLKSCSGQLKDTLHIKDAAIGIYGNSKLTAFIGHDGLMDFKLTEQFTNTDNRKRDAIILACISKRYFAPHLAATKANALVWSTGLMAPEAYTLHDALQVYINKGSTEDIKTAAAKAYARYQKCGEKAARNLLVSGY